MSQVIIYEPSAGQVAIISPTQEILDAGYTVAQIAAKDVPHNMPYKIIDSSTVPTDRTFRNAWEWDGDLQTDNDGLGAESNELPILE